MKNFLYEYGLVIVVIVILACIIALAVYMSKDTGNTTDGKIVQMKETIDDSMENIENNRSDVKFFDE